MEHIKLETCDSTQIVLRDIVEQGNTQLPVCVSSLRQTAGRGRGDNKWNTFESSLAFSFSYPRPNAISLAPLFFGIAICQWVEMNFNKKVGLKWPNDIFEGSLKIGGILCHLHQDTLIVGVGLNMGPVTDDNFKFKPASLSHNSRDSEEIHDLCHDLAKFIHEQKFNPVLVQKAWGKYSVHSGKVVGFNNDSEVIEGRFLGISEIGEAIIEMPDGQRKNFISGSIDYFRN